MDKITTAEIKEGKEVATLSNLVNIGTEEVSQEDLNTPILKIIQSTTVGIDNMKIGAYYRSDIKEQFDEVDVNLVYVTTEESENYNKTAMEKVKVYYGFYNGTNEPFKMYVRGWGLASHRNFQTEVVGIKNRFKVPMLSLTVVLKTEKQQGTIKETGKPYTTYKPVFEIVKAEDGQPLVENDQERLGFLVKSVSKFSILTTPSVNDEAQNEPEIDNDKIPF